MMIDAFDEDVVGKNESVPIIREEAISSTKKSMGGDEKWLIDNLTSRLRRLL